VSQIARSGVVPQACTIRGIPINVVVSAERVTLDRRRAVIEWTPALPRSCPLVSLRCRTRV